MPILIIAFLRLSTIRSLTVVSAGRQGTLLIMTFDSYRNWEGLSDEQYSKKKRCLPRN
jgi:hypothetical protein